MKGKLREEKAAIAQKVESEPRHKNSTGTGTKVRKKDPLGRKQ